MLISALNSMVTMEKTMINAFHHLWPDLICRQPAETRMLTMGATKGKTSKWKPKVGYASV